MKMLNGPVILATLVVLMTANICLYNYCRQLDKYQDPYYSGKAKIVSVGAADKFGYQDGMVEFRGKLYVHSLGTTGYYKPGMEIEAKKLAPKSSYGFFCWFGSLHLWPFILLGAACFYETVIKKRDTDGNFNPTRLSKN